MGPGSTGYVPNKRKTYPQPKRPISKTPLPRPERPISKTPIPRPARPISRTPAQSLAHPQSHYKRGGRAADFGISQTFNGNKQVQAARPMPRSKVAYSTKNAGSAIKTKPTPTLTISTQSPSATSSKPGFGVRLKSALKHSAQTQKIKALQRQHKAARAG